MGGPAPYCESAGVSILRRRFAVCERGAGECHRAYAYVKPRDIIKDCCVSLRGHFKALSHSHKDFQGAHGNEIGTPHGLTNPQREDPEHNTEKVYRENFHTEAS